MHLRYVVAALLLASVALWPGQPAGGEAPALAPPPASVPAAEPAAAPAPATPVPAVPTPVAPAPVAPAAPAVTPAAPPKGPPVIMAALPTLSGVFGGKVEFAEKAFPIVAEAKDVGVQNAIRATKLLPCQVCKGTGKVNKRELIKPGPAVRGTAIWQTWEEDCQACGGFKDVYDPRFGQRLLEVVDRLGHVLRDAKFDELRKEAEGRLVEAVDVRDKTITTLRCKPTIRTEQRMETDSYGNISTHTIQTLTGATTEPDQQKPFHVDVAPLVEPLWMRVGPQAPIGQAVIIIGTTSDKTEAAGWVWMRLKPLGKGPEAILLCGTPQANVAPAGKVVFGGLMVGRWIPEGGAEAPQPVAPVAGAKGPPPSTVGLLPKGTLPVILAVVAAEGK